MAERHTLRTGPLLLGILFFVLVGTPMVAYLWETLNELLSGYVDPMRLLISVPVLLLFLGLLALLGRTVRRWEGERRDAQASPPATGDSR